MTKDFLEEQQPTEDSKKKPTEFLSITIEDEKDATEKESELEHTRRFQLNEFKEELAKEEWEVQQLAQMEPTHHSEESVFKAEKDNTSIHEAELEESTLTPEMRRRYWQEKQAQEELEKRPFHRYPNYFYAGFWMRLFAYLIDLFVIQSIGRLSVNNLFTAFHWPKEATEFSSYSLAHIAVYLLYFILFTKLTNGQTLGKMVFGLRVVCFKEEKLSWGTVIIREGFCRYMLSVTFFGFKVLQMLYLVLLFTPQKQHVGDLLSDTSVVTENVLKASQLEA